MIVSGDVATILARDLDSLCKNIYKKGAIPEGEVLTERIVILPKGLKEGTYWSKGFVEVNFCIPNAGGMANTIRLTEVERILKPLESVSLFDNTRYRYSVESTSQEEDTPLACWYVNARILFEVLN